MRRLTTTMAAGACLLLAAPSAADSLAERLPAEAIIVFGVADFDGLRGKWESSPLSAAWGSPEMANALQMLEEPLEEIASDFSEEFGIQLDEFLGVLKGGAVYAAFDRGDDMGVAFVADVAEGARAEFERVFDAMMDATIPDDARRSLDEFAGTRIYRVSFVDPDDGGESHREWAYTDEHFVSGDFDGSVRMVLNAMGSPAAALSSSDSFRKVQGMQPSGADVFFWLDLPALVEKGIAESPDPNAGRLADTLALRGIGPMGITLALADDRASFWSGIGIPAQRRGLFQLLEAFPPNPVDTASQTPSDALAYFSWTLDGGALFRAVLDIAGAVEPAAAMTAQGFLAQFGQQLGFDLRNDLIGNLQGEHFAYTRESDDPDAEGDGANVAVLLNWRNGQQAGDALDTLLSMLVDDFRLPLESGNAQGFRTWTVREDPGMPPMPFAPVLGLTPSRFLFTTGMAEMQDAMRAAQGSVPGGGLAANREFRAAMDRADLSNAIFVSYSSPESIGVQLDAIRAAFQMTGAPASEVGAIPSAEWAARYFGASYSVLSLTPESLTATQELFLRR